MKTRSSFQHGYVEQRKRKNGIAYVLRWRVRDPGAKNGWRIKSETLRGCPNKKTAMRELDMRMREVNLVNNGTDKPSPTTFGEFTSGAWAHYMDNNALKPSTRYSYDSMCQNYLLPEFGCQPLNQITSLQLSLFFDRLRKQKVAQQYQLNIYALVRAMFEVAFQHDLLPASPVRRKLHRPRVSRKEKPVLSAKEIRQVLDEISAYWKPLFICVAVLGMRTGELLGLRWKNVDWKAQNLRITHSLWRGELTSPKTRASRRILHIPDELFNILRDHHEKSAFTDPDDFIFCKVDGSSADPDYLREKVLYPAMDSVGIKRSPRSHGFHLFRHSVASIVHEKTGSVKVAQTLLGHSRIDTTGDIYVHVDEKSTKQASEAVAQEIIPSCSPIAHQTHFGGDRVH